MIPLERKTIADLVLHFPEDRMEEEVLVFLNADGKAVERFSFRQLRKQVLSAAQHLYTPAVKGKVVPILTDNQAEFVQAFFGCVLAGMIPVPLPVPKSRQDRPAIDQLLHILTEHNVSLLIVSDESCELLSDSFAHLPAPKPNVLSVSVLRKEPLFIRALPEIDPDAIAYLQYTSGSTFQPKGVVLRHRQVLSNLAQMYRVFNRGERVRVAGWIPFHHDMGLVGHLFTVLYESGFGVFMQPASFLARPALWLSAIGEYNANSAAAPTFAFEHCCRKIQSAEPFDLSCWKHAYVGSETVSPDVLNRFHAKFADAGFDRNSFKPVYGLAEVTLLAAGGSMGFAELDQFTKQKKIGKGQQRALIPYSIEKEMQISIHDPETGAIYPDRTEGEIWLSGESVGDGYFGKKDSGFANGCVKTGDMGFVDEGYLYITGRCKDMVILRGVNYAAEDLELAARFEQSLLNSNDSTVCVSHIGTDGELFFVFQEVHRHKTAEEHREIAAQITENLAQHYGIIPTAVLILSNGYLPRTRNHKLSRRACLEQYLTNKLKILYSSVATEIPAPVKEDSDEIVIVGMACSFPGGADSPEKFWDLLAHGKDAITEIPPDRWDSSIFYDPKPAVPGKMNTRWAGFINGIDRFDATLFGISPHEAPEIDPQQRLLLETSWRLMEHAGWKKEQLAGSETGVFIGISTNDYLYMKIKLIPGMESFNAYSGLGNANSVAANRISYFYDLKGPSLAVDTACSSSLTAFHLGASAIINGECRQAIVGGVNAILSPGPGITLSQFGMMSPQGHCKTFDASADGYVRAEGCGLVMLKKLSEAIKDGDRILAIVKASATGQDGHTPGITFPNGAAQRKLLEKTLRLSGCTGSSIGYIEAHGTGTSAGDPVEMEQLTKVYGTGNADTCYVGSVKANIGHLEAAAGIASVIKALLVLDKAKIPPQVHFTELNPRIELKGTRLAIPIALTEWKKNKSVQKRIAISSFGFGGSLAHVILEEPKAEQIWVAPVELNLSHMTLFVLSAHSPESLIEQAHTWIKWLQTDQELSIFDICRSQALGRTYLKYRQFFLVSSGAALIKKLEEFIKVNRVATLEVQRNNCFLFTGQGEYYQDMGSELYHHFPVFAHAFDRCAAAVNNELEGHDLYRLAFQSTDLLTMGSRFLQPVSFAVQYALGILLEQCGCTPNVLLGHSLGEYAAACLSGCFEPETGIKIIRERGKLIDNLSVSGKMATIFCTAAEIDLQLDSAKANIAAVNSAGKTVVAGDVEEVNRLMAYFNSKGISSADIKTQYAFHSHHMDSILDTFHDFLRQFSFKPPSRKWISSLTGELMQHAPDARHWVSHLRNKVNFEKAARSLAIDRAWNFIELGPGSGTLLAVSESMDCSNSLLLRTLNFKKGDRTEMYFVMDSLGQLFRSGLNLDLSPVLKGGFHPHLIPGQTFKHASYWMEGLTAEKLSAFATSGKSLPEETRYKTNLHYHLPWVEAASHTELVPLANVKDANWIILGDNGELAREVIAQLRACKAHVFQISTLSESKGSQRPDIIIPDLPDKHECRKALDTLVNYKSLVGITDWRLIFITGSHFSHTTSTVGSEIDKNMSLLLALVQALQESIPVHRLWIVTERSQYVPGTGQNDVELNPAAAVVWGFAKTLFLEHPEWRGGMIDVDKGGELAETLIKKIIKPGTGGESCIAIRGAAHYVQQLSPATKLAASVPVLRNDGAYLITGGLGGLGLESAYWLAEKGIQHIVLIARRQFPGQDRWKTLAIENPDYAVAQQLMNLTAKGVKIEILSADIRDTALIEQVFASLDSRNIPVRGVIHAAGVNWFSKIMQLDREQFLETLKIKTTASWTLHRLTAHRDLDCFILFSSVSALWGSVDLSHYTAANHFMDILSHYRHALGLVSSSINWGPWADVGMSAAQREKEVLEKLGFTLLPPRAALAAMDMVLAEKLTISLIADVDWHKFRLFSDFSLQPSLFRQLVHADINEKRSMPGMSALIRSSEPEKARAMIEDAVRTELRMVMLIESMEGIHAEQRFNFLGMDSLMAITFVVRLEEYFDYKLPSTLVYNYPTIRAVCEYLFEMIYHGGEAGNKNSTEGIKGPSTKMAASNRILLKESLTPEKVTLFCFPCAGSGASSYASWANHFNGNIDIIGLQPPGREDRSDETPFTRIEDIVKELLLQHIDTDGDFYFFGHSLGALVAYEFYKTLKLNNRKLPSKIFLCGCGLPLEASGSNIHHLEGDEFIEAVAGTYGEQQLSSGRRNALQHNSKLLKHDIAVLENYQPQLVSIDVPLVVICGIEDRLAPPEEVEKWKQLVTTEFQIFSIQAGHDLVKDHTPALTDIIGSVIGDHLHPPHQTNS